jgi:hypothetical protein
VGDIFQNGFEAGEIDKWCLGKTGDPAYQLGCARLENFSLLGSGGVNRRQGYRSASRILEIRPPEYRVLDKAEGFEEERRIPDTMTGDAAFRRADTVFGTDTSAARLIPVPGGGGRNYLVYVLAQKYGYIEFDGFEARDRKEHSWPAAPSIKKGHSFKRRARDPDAYYRIKGISGLNTRADFAIGEKIPLQDASVIEPGEAVISGVQESELARIDEVSAFDIRPESGVKTYVLTQEKGDGLSYFDEKGAGTGLDLQCSCRKEDTDITLSFTVISGGSGFDPGKTTLRLRVQELGEVVVNAVAGSTGAITSVSDYKYTGIPEKADNIAVMRWEAPVIKAGEHSEVKDWFGRSPVMPPVIRVWVNEEEAGYPALGKVYGISFGEERTENGKGTGYGSGWLKKASGGSGFESTVTRVPAPADENPGTAVLNVSGTLSGWVSGGTMYGYLSGYASGNTFEGPVTANLWIYGLKHADVMFQDDEAGFTALLTARHAVKSGEAGYSEAVSLTGGSFTGIKVKRAAVAAVPGTDTAPAVEAVPGIDIAIDGPVSAGVSCTGWVRPVSKNVCFLKILHVSDVSDEPCQRELRVVAELEGGAIKYIHPVPYWIDDDVAADALPEENDPYGKGGIFNRLFSQVKWVPNGYNNMKLLMNQNGKYMRDFVATDVLSFPRNVWNGNSEVHILQDFGGLWYLKTAPVRKGYINFYEDLIYRVSEYRFSLIFAHFYYPVMARFNNSGAYDKFLSSMYAASGCPKTVSSSGAVSAVPRIQFYNDGRPYSASYKFRLEERGGRWFLPDPRNSPDDDGYNWGAVADAETRNYLVESAGAYAGKGAIIRVTPAYLRPARGDAGFGTAIFTITLLDAGKEYLLRETGTVVLYLEFREENQDYAYRIEVNAARGSDGKLVLKGPSGETASVVKEGGTEYARVTYEADADIRVKPPETGGAVTLTGKEEGANKGDTIQAEAKVTAVYGADRLLEKWEVRCVIPRSASGEPMSRPLYKANEKLDASWIRESVSYGPAAVEVTKIAGTKTYSARLLNGGRFAKDVKGNTFYGISGGRSWDIYIAETEVEEDTILQSEKYNPAGERDGNLYEVADDEVYGGIKSYWHWRDGGWHEAAVNVYPSGDAVLAGLQHCWTGKYLILCGYGITPFTLEIADGDIAIGGLEAVTAVSVDVTKPREFGLAANTYAADEALPALFMRTANYSPSVIAYINGRLWVSGLPDDPARIYVSKPVRDKGSRVFDFSTYKLFVTVTPELTPFQAENATGSNLLAGASDGAIGLAAEYAQTPLSAGKAVFGYDKARILATPYFPEGAAVESAGKEIGLSKSSAAGTNEYTAEAAAELRNKAALYTGFGRIKVTVPGASCAVTADCDGFEIMVSTGSMFAGMVFSLGPVSSGYLAVPYTGWGAPGSERASRIAMAVAAAAMATGGGIPAAVAVAASCAAILTVAQGTVDSLMDSLINKIRLGLTDGSSDSPSLSEFGASYASLGAIQAKCEYLLAKHKLYEPKQPFVMRRWKLEEKEYSTPECGFTFKASGEGPEAVNFIADTRGVFFSTDSGERLMPATANGAEQSVQSGSFYGSERLQAARGADALYFVMKGGQAVMRAAYAPNVPVPVVAGLQGYNREILRGRKVTGIRGGKTLPVTVWCLTEDGAAAVVTDAGGKAAWSRVSSGAGALLDTGAVSVNGLAAMRFVGIRAENGVYVGAGDDGPGGKEGVYLDLWQEYTDASLLDGYGDGAVVYDTAARTAAPVKGGESAPEPGQGKYIGYPYESVLRTLPFGTAASLKPSRIPAARLRLLESHLPFVRGCPSGMVNRMVHPLWGGTAAELNAARDGVVSVPVPGNTEQDAAFEVFTDVPAPLSVICLVAEEET